MGQPDTSSLAHDLLHAEIATALSRTATATVAVRNVATHVDCTSRSPVKISPESLVHPLTRALLR